jgi:hypothetical protein
VSQELPRGEGGVAHEPVHEGIDAPPPDLPVERSLVGRVAEVLARVRIVALVDVAVLAGVDVVTTRGDPSPRVCVVGKAAPACRCPCCAAVCTPGSPARSTTDPGTKPPPSTRSSSPMPVGWARARSGSCSPIGRAGLLTGPGRTDRTAAPAPPSISVPHA